MTLLNRLPIILFIAVNCLFLVKYLSRYTDCYPIITITYVIFAGALLILGNRIPDKYFNKNQIYGILGLFSIGAVIALAQIDLASLNVDRWSVIASFWESAFNGDFPYAAKSIHDNMPGPFPFYFILALPFHLIGEIGYMPILGLFGFAWLLVKRSKSVKPVVVLLLLMVSAPAIIWEVAGRSTILLNMVVVLLYLFFLEFNSPKKSWELFAIGLIGGFILSTRGFVAIPYLAFFSFAYLRTGRWQEFFMQGFGIVAGFLITLLPFVMDNFEQFKIYNPITLQAGFLNLPLLLVFFTAAAAIGYRAKNVCIFYRNLSILLFLVISTAFVKTVMEYGWQTSFHSSAFDISYYILSLPFLALACPRLSQDDSL